MPRVPSVGLSPTSRPQFQAPQVVAFQGGPELQQIAQGGARMQRIGEVVNQIGLEIEDKVNDARAMEAVNTFENGASKAYLEYQQKKGKDGVDGYEDYQKQIQELQDGAGGLLMNDQQRALASQAFSKINSRFNLRGQEHYMETSAQYKQAQNIASQAVLRDNMIANPEDPQSLADFGRFNNLVMEQGRAEGLDGEALEVFAMGKRDELFQSIVTAGLDSEDPARIRGVEALMAALPDGVISQTQSQALGRLVNEKTLDTQARQEAAAHMDDGGNLASGLSTYFKMVEQDPKKAAIYLEQVTKLADIQNKIRASNRGALRQKMEADMINNGAYTASDLQQAENLGILADMKDYERKYKQGSREDINSERGDRDFAEFLSSPNLMRERYDSWNELYDAHRGDIRQTDMEILAQQWARTAPPEEEPPEILGPRALRGAKFSDSDRDLVRALLLEFDQKIKTVEGDYLSRFQVKYGENQRTTITSRRSAMEAKWISAVLDKYEELTSNDEWSNRNNNPSHQQALQIVSQIVWDGGWQDTEHTINSFTTEVDEIPSTPEDLAPYRQQAVSELRADGLMRTYAQFMSPSDVPGLMVTAPEYQAELVEQVLKITPEGAGMLALANTEAAMREATDVISPAEVRQRQQALYERDRKRQLSQDQRSQESAMQSVAQDLLGSISTVTTGEVSMHRGTKMDREMYYKLFGEGTPIGRLFTPERLRPSERREMFIKFHSGENGVIDKLQSTGMSPSEARDFVLMFYVGEESDLDRKTQLRLQALPGAEGESRWKKLERFFVNGQFRQRDTEGRLNMNELYDLGRGGGDSK